jgi:predicted Zn-dependent protease
MNGVGAFTKGLSDVMALWKDRKYDRALKRVDELRKTWPGSPQLHVMWADLVQLQEETTHTLEDARRALQQAVELDKQSPAAAIVLGSFLDNVEDDPEAAAKVFAQAVAAARHHLIEGLLGQARSLTQLERGEEAVRCLVEAHRLADAEPTSRKGPIADRIEELLKELGQMQTA